MKNLDKNQKIAIIAFAVFILFLLILSTLAQSGAVPDFGSNQRIQGVLSFITFLPLIIGLRFCGKYFKSKESKIGGTLTFVSIALFVFGILQALLSLLGAYGS